MTKIKIKIELLLKKSTKVSLSIKFLVLIIFFSTFIFFGVQNNKYNPHSKKRYILHQNDMMVIPGEKTYSNIEFQTNSIGGKVFRASNQSLQFSHFNHYTLNSTLKEKEVINHKFNEETLIHKLYLNAGSEITLKTQYSPFRYTLSIYKTEIKINSFGNNEIKTRVFRDWTIFDESFHFVVKESSQYTIQIELTYGSISNERIISLEINSLQYILPNSENEVINPMNHKISLENEDAELYFIKNSGINDFEFIIVQKQNYRTIFTSLLWITSILVILQLCMMNYHISSKKFLGYYNELIGLEASFPPINQDSLLKMKKKFDQLSIKGDSDTKHINWSYRQNFNSKLNIMRPRLQSFIDKHVASLKKDTTGANIEKIQILKQIITSSNHKEIKQIIKYLQIEKELLKTIQNFSAKYNHIHLVEIQDTMKISQKKLEEYIPMLIERGMIDAKYDSIHNNISFDWHVEEEMENLTNLFDNWEENNQKKKS